MVNQSVAYRSRLLSTFLSTLSHLQSASASPFPAYCFVITLRRSPRMLYLLLSGLTRWLYSGSCILLAPLEQLTFHSCHLLFPAVLPWLFQPESSPPSSRRSWLVPLLLAPGLHSLLSSPLLLQSFLRALTSLPGLRCHSRRRRTESSSLVLPHIQHPLESSPMEAAITPSLPPRQKAFLSLSPALAPPGNP